MLKTNYQPFRSSILKSENAKLNEELTVIAIGNSTLPHGYHFHMNRNIYVIHFLISGKGTAMGIPVQAPAGFLLAPGTQYFQVDGDEKLPEWEQFWIMVAGKNVPKHLAAAGFPTHAGVFEIPYHHRLPPVFQFLYRDESSFECDDDYYFLSILNRVFSFHSYYNLPTRNARKRIRNKYVQSAVNYIRENYFRKITGADIAANVHISFKYLYQLFVGDLGIPPIKYLNQYRIYCAQNILQTQNVSVNQVAEAVGFSSPDYFCNVFKKYSNGLSPSEYKAHYI